MPHIPGHEGPANGTQKQTGYVIKSTGDPYSGLVLEYGGRLVTTKTGTYEGYFSKTLTIGSAAIKTLNGGIDTPGASEDTSPPLNGNGNTNGGNGEIVIDTPGANDQQTNQGGGGMY